MTILEEALNSSRCVISVMGEHAGESVQTIFERKAADIQRIGKTFWLIRSPKARPGQIREICKSIPSYGIFVEPASKGGARPTSDSFAAKEFSIDKKEWHHLPDGLGPVTGKMDSCAVALVFDFMTTSVHGSLDLWEYADASDIEKPIKLGLGCSTICAVRSNMSGGLEKMKSRYRGVVAVARLAEPYGVWLR
jgi:hypothetical protein